MVLGAALLESSVDMVDKKVVNLGLMIGPRPADLFGEDVVMLWDGILDVQELAAEAKIKANEAAMQAATTRAMRLWRSPPTSGSSQIW